MAGRERTPHEQQTLIFSNQEQAGEFRERVERQASQPNTQGGQSVQRQVVAKELAKEFEQEGEVVSSLHQPWEHSTEEHHEVQVLVNEAFEKDFRAALNTARQSQYYPRNLDLLHDVLTEQMYDVLSQQHLNKQPIIGWIIAVLVIILVALIVSITLFILA